MAKVTLPAGARWYVPVTPHGHPTQADLLMGGDLVARVKPFGERWIALFAPAFAPGAKQACVVGSLAKGQNWISRQLARGSAPAAEARAHRELAYHPLQAIQAVNLVPSL